CGDTSTASADSQSMCPPINLKSIKLCNDRNFSMSLVKAACEVWRVQFQLLKTITMQVFEKVSRRVAVKSSVFGLLTISIPNMLFAKHVEKVADDSVSDKAGARYPSI